LKTSQQKKVEKLNLSNNNIKHVHLML